ncbi:MAG: anti-sigma factor [Deltaproteobacteria bacterium]|nr:MAG: anti-sigma factor [Deltaproteobacteria bacterium]
MNPNEREHFEELCASYVLDALEADEAAQLEQMLQQVGPDDVAFFQSMQEVALLLPLEAEPVAPPAVVRQRLLDEVRRRKQALSSSSSSMNALTAAVAWWQSLTLAWSAAMVFLIAGAGASYMAWNYTGRVDSLQKAVVDLRIREKMFTAEILRMTKANQKQRKLLAQNKSEIKAIRNELERKTKLAQLLATRNVELVRMQVGRSRKTRSYKGGYGKLLWNPKTNKALLQLANLPRLKDKSYQLWMIEAGRKLPYKAGVFAYEGDKANFFEAPVPAPKRRRRLQFAVSVEPKGGSPKPTPTGPIIMATKKIRISL